MITEIYLLDIIKYDIISIDKRIELVKDRVV